MRSQTDFLLQAPTAAKLPNGKLLQQSKFLLDGYQTLWVTLSQRYCLDKLIYYQFILMQVMKKRRSL